MPVHDQDSMPLGLKDTPVQASKVLQIAVMMVMCGGAHHIDKGVRSSAVLDDADAVFCPRETPESMPGPAMPKCQCRSGRVQNNDGW